MHKTLILASLAAALTTGALACETRHALEYEMGSGDAVLTVNGVFYQKMSGEGGTMMNFIAWTLPGDNVIDVSYVGDGPATFQLVSGCKGGWDTEPASDKVDLSGGGKTSFTFAQQDDTDAAFEQTRPSDDAGLSEAYETFREAVMARDTESVIEQLDLFIARAERQGFPRDAMTEHLTTALEKGEMDLQEDGKFTAAAGGRVYYMMTPDYEPTLVAYYTAESGGKWTVPFGTYWAKLDGKWQVIYN